MVLPESDIRVNCKAGSSHSSNQMDPWAWMVTIGSLGKVTHLSSTLSKAKIVSNFAYIPVLRILRIPRVARHRNSLYASSLRTVSSLCLTSCTLVSRESRPLVGTLSEKLPLWLLIPRHRPCYAILVQGSRSSVSSIFPFVSWRFPTVRASISN